MTLTELIEASAERMSRVGVAASSNHGWVLITDLDGFHDDIFLQGDDASVFISEVKRLWNELGDVTESDCCAHLAEPYVEAFWN